MRIFNDFLKATHMRQIKDAGFETKDAGYLPIICRLSGNNRPITDYLENGDPYKWALLTCLFAKTIKIAFFSSSSYTIFETRK